MGFKNICSVGPSPEKLKEKVNKKLSPEVIFYNGNIYAIRYQELRNLGLDYRSKIDKLCAQRGLPDTVFFSPACHYCDHSNLNVFERVMQSQGPVLINHLEEEDLGCNYKGIGIKIATIFKGSEEKQDPFYAIDNGCCAFTDSLVSYLADNNKLIGYQLKNFNFNFKSIMEFEESSKIPEEFLERNIKKRLKNTEFIDINKSQKKKSFFNKLFS